MQSQWITILVLLFGLQGTKQTKPTPPDKLKEAPHLRFNLNSKQAKAFLPVYVEYIKLIQTKGTQGLKELFSSDFTLRSEKALLHGQKSVDFMDQMRTNDETGEISVRVRQLVFKKDIVVASITELRHFTTSRSGKPDMVGSWNKNWRQTWRKTAKGWKLTLMENETKEVKGDGLILTITSPFVKK